MPGRKRTPYNRAKWAMSKIDFRVWKIWSKLLNPVLAEKERENETNPPVSILFPCH